MNRKSKINESTLSKDSKLRKMIKSFVRDDLKYIDSDYFTALILNTKDFKCFIGFDRYLKDLGFKNSEKGYQTKLWEQMMKLGISVEQMDKSEATKNLLLLMNEVNKWKKSF